MGGGVGDQTMGGVRNTEDGTIYTCIHFLYCFWTRDRQSLPPPHPQWYPPHPPKFRGGGIPFILPSSFFFPSFMSSFPSSFLLSLLPFSFPSLFFPFFLPSFLRSYVSSTSPPQGGGDALQHYCNRLSFIFSLNPFCF